MLITIAPGRRLFVDIEGSGLVPDGAHMREKPTLVLLHGGPGYDHSGYKPLFSRLADVAQIVYFDQHGHGRSDRCPADEWTLDHFADDVVRLCDALGIAKPIVLGQSFGGFVAQRYLARHPGHPARVVLSSTSPHLGLKRKLAWFQRLGGQAAHDAAKAFWTTPSDATMEPYRAICIPLYNTTPQTDALAAERAVMNLDILYTWNEGEGTAVDLLPGLAQVRCPVLVMAGEQDPVCPIEGARDIAAAISQPWAQLVTFPGAGHGVWRDQTDAALDCLRTFIKGGMQGAGNLPELDAGAIAP